jgi:apolipoprotein N-acyltransferase
MRAIENRVAIVRSANTGIFRFRRLDGEVGAEERYFIGEDSIGAGSADAHNHVYTRHGAIVVLSLKGGLADERRG